MKLQGRIVSGPYSGQAYWFVRKSLFPRWVEVCLVDENGHNVRREVREDQLEF